MAALWDEYARRGDAAVEAFWAEVDAAGTPLIEPLEGDDGHSAVTFVWRLEEPDQRVGLVHGPLGVGELDLLDHLGTSDLAFRTYRVANDLRNAYWFMREPVRSLDARSADEWAELERRRARGGLLTGDPLNRRVRPHFSDPLDPATEEPGQSVLEMPDAPRSLVELTEGGATDRLSAHRWDSPLLQAPRTVWVHEPAVPAGPGGYGVLIAFDGHRALDAMGLPAILDGLTAARAIRPTIAVFIESLFDWRHVELPRHEPFADFLAEELMPWLAARFAITADPTRTTLTGVSLGGLAASFVALRHPERFGNVLSQSGAYWWEPIDLEARYIAPEERRGGWHAAAYEAAPRAPVRFYLDVGLLEGGRGTSTDLLREVRRFRDVLLGRGYEVTYREYNGGHAWACWRAAFADALVSLVGTAPDGR